MTDILLILTGLVVGIMNAIAGGGMLVGFPVLVALGIPPLTANVTGNLITSPGQLSSAWGYRQYLRKVPARFLWLLVPLMVGSVGGALILRHTSAHDFARIVPGLVLFGLLLFAFQPLLHFHVRQHLRGKHRTLWPLLLIGLAMLPLGLYAGYFGAGFGFMMLAFLSLAHLPDTHMINAMKNVGAFFVSLTALLFLYSTGRVDWHVGVLAGIGALIGGYVGSRLSQRLSARWLRVTVIIIGLGAVIYLAAGQYH